MQSYQVSFVKYFCSICWWRSISSACKTTKKKKTPILEGIKSRRCTRTLARYVSDAAKFCLLAGGGKLSKRGIFSKCTDNSLGSALILAIAATGGLRSSIRSLTHDIVLRINYLLRCPNPGKVFTLIFLRYLIIKSRSYAWEIGYTGHHSCHLIVEAAISVYVFLHVQPRTPLQQRSSAGYRGRWFFTIRWVFQLHNI